MSDDKVSPPPRAMGQLTADDPDGVSTADDPSSVGTTIVGGQPSGSPRRQVNKVPVGVERVLYTAAIEPSFRARLLAERETAVAERGFTLRPSELAMIRLAPAEQLSAAIDNLDTSDRGLERRGFMRAVAASLVTLAAADTISACAEEPSPAGQRVVEGGVRTWDGPRLGADMGVVPGDINIPRDTPEFNPDAGVRPDVSVDVRREELGPAGIRPDNGAVDLEIDLGPAVDGIRPDGGK